MTDAGNQPLTELLFRREVAEMIKAGAEPVSAHMAIEQSFMWENLSVTTVAQILDAAKAETLDLGHLPERRMGGLRIFESRNMPANRIEFRNAEGEKVGEIINLAMPAEFK